MYLKTALCKFIYVYLYRRYVQQLANSLHASEGHFKNSLIIIIVIIINVLVKYLQNVYMFAFGEE